MRDNGRTGKIQSEEAKKKIAEGRKKAHEKRRKEFLEKIEKKIPDYLTEWNEFF